MVASGGGMNPDWHLPSVCDLSDGSATRAPAATAPEPDDRSPLEADLSLLFPWGFFVIGCRFIVRALLALGGAVSTDPNAAHGGDHFDPTTSDAIHPKTAVEHAPVGASAVTAQPGQEDT